MTRRRAPADSRSAPPSSTATPSGGAGPAKAGPGHDVAESSRVGLGIAYKIGATALFASMGALIKSTGPDYPIGQVVFSRSVFALIPVLVLVRHAGGLAVLRTRRPGGHLLRSLSGFMAMTCSFAGLTLLPLADATALGFVSPLMTTALAVPLLGERVRIYRWSAVLVGFAGVLLMLRPAGTAGGPMLIGAVPLGVVLALLGALFTALAMIAIRRMAAAEPSITIVFWFTASCTALGALTLPFAFRLPPASDAVALVGIGLLGGCAQVLLTNSYRLAPASTLAPFDYTAMLWALVIGYVVFREVPEPLVMAGAAIVIASGLFIVWRERRLGLSRAPARRAGEGPTPPAV